MPGADGDNWFHLEGDLTAATTLADAPSFPADLGLRLPPATGVAEKSVFTLSVSVAGPVTAAPMALRLQVGGGTVAYTDGPGDWIVDFSRGPAQNFSRRIESDGRATALTVTLLPPDQPAAQSSAVFFDDIAWQQPVRLSLNGQGAAFRGVAGTWRYQVSGAPAGAWLYDVSDPRRPQTLATAAVANFEFQDGPTAHAYVVAGEGTLHTPRLQAHRAVAWGKGADAVYIAPQIFHAALQPLVELRTRQGYQVQVVDVQDIFDAWSYGAMDPQAIRNFLRYAVSAWQPSPISAVLVGDGTWDPRNYLATGNPTHIPPYLADVDPWLRVTACEFCYAQLDFDDPLDDSLIDIWLGRFPVADAVELAAVVDKIVRYESAVDPAAPWRSLSVQMADDYVESPDGALDRAGNFWKLVESVIKQQPSLLTIARVYYNVTVDPAVLDPATRQWYEAVRPWLQTSESAAQAAARGALSAGAGLVTFTGHANHWQWARMGPVSGYDHRLFGLLDVGGLTNRDAPFIGLAMTCYSSQFAIPEQTTHTTLDERLFLHPNGGAVAMWGPAGLSIAYGHDILQTGFYRALWRAKPLQAKLGALTQSGYNAIVLDTPCCQDVARTFVLMGDPLTPARVQPLAGVYLPWISAARAAGEPAFRLRLPWVTTSRP